MQKKIPVQNIHNQEEVGEEEDVKDNFHKSHNLVVEDKNLLWVVELHKDQNSLNSYSCSYLDLGLDLVVKDNLKKLCLVEYKRVKAQVVRHIIICYLGIAAQEVDELKYLNSYSYSFDKPCNLDLRCNYVQVICSKHICLYELDFFAFLSLYHG